MDWMEVKWSRGWISPWCSLSTVSRSRGPRFDPGPTRYFVFQYGGDTRLNVKSLRWRWEVSWTQMTNEALDKQMNWFYINLNSQNKAHLSTCIYQQTCTLTSFLFFLFWEGGVGGVSFTEKCLNNVCADWPFLFLCQLWRLPAHWCCRPGSRTSSPQTHETSEHPWTSPRTGWSQTERKRNYQVITVQFLANFFSPKDMHDSFDATLKGQISQRSCKQCSISAAHCVFVSTGKSN